MEKGESIVGSLAIRVLDRVDSMHGKLVLLYERVDAIAEMLESCQDYVEDFEVKVE